MSHERLGTDPKSNPDSKNDSTIAAAPPIARRGNQRYVDEGILIYPDTNHIEIEDDTPVDNFQSEKQQRLLVEPLYDNRDRLPTPFIAAANVGVFFGIHDPPLVPDAFLSLRVQMPADWSRRENRTYFAWEFGKMPEVAIEIVSNRKGKELGDKLQRYAQIGISYYAVFDPLRQIQDPDLMNGVLLRTFGLTQGTYTELAEPWFETIGLGLAVWQGSFEDQVGEWLRWCDRSGTVLPTGWEQAEQERQRAEQERQRAEQERQRAEQERQKAEQERQKAEQERQRADRLAERLRALGIDPNDLSE